MWFFLLVCIFVLVWSLQKITSRMKGLPPGPFRFPGIGCLVQIFLAHPKLPFIAFQKFSKYYGNIFYVQLGLVNAVVVSGYDNIHEIYQNEDWIERVDDKYFMDRTFGKRIGLFTAQFDIWKESRRFSSRTLREFGFGVKKSMETLIQGELDIFSTSLMHRTQRGNGIVLADNLFHAAVLNITWSMVTGTHFSYDDPKLLQLMGLLDDFTKSGSMGAGLLTAYPFLTDWAPKLVGFDKQEKANREIQQYLQDIIAEIRFQGHYRTNPSNFIEVFLQKIDTRESTGDMDDLIYSDENLISILYDFFFGGAETSSNSITFGCLQMILNPDIQERVQGEIEGVIGDHRSPTLVDKERLPYTEATILEIFRTSNVIPVSPRKLYKEATIGKYRLPKGTVALLNLYSLSMDENVWGDPYVFRPERFLSPEGKIINSDRIMPFGAGKRTCVGESVARATIFIMFTGLLQKFKFAVNLGEETPSEECVLGFTLSPKPFTMIVTPRH